MLDQLRSRADKLDVLKIKLKGVDGGASLTTITDEIKTSVVVAEASTKAMLRSALTGTIPIIEFGALIAFSMIIASIPVKLIRRINNG